MEQPTARGAVKALAAAVVSIAVLWIGTAHATDPVVKCQEKKLKARGKLELCLKKNSAKVLGGQPDASAACTTKFQDALSKAGTACRYLDNGDGTLSDLNTGLQWEKKTGTEGSFPMCVDPTCPAGDTFSGTYTAGPPCAGGTFTIVVSADGSAWTGTSVDTGACGTVTDSGSISGNTLTGTGDGGLIAISGTFDCANAHVSGTFSGAVSGSWMGDDANFCPDPHDVNNLYAWSATGTVPDGAAFTGFLAKLNDCQSSDGTILTSGFAGHCDWRLPTIVEVQGIVDATGGQCGGGSGGCIDPAFGPTQAYFYWSATTVAGNPARAWGAGFDGGGVDFTSMTASLYVRAVRNAP